MLQELKESRKASVPHIEKGVRKETLEGMPFFVLFLFLFFCCISISLFWANEKKGRGEETEERRGEESESFSRGRLRKVYSEGVVV